MGIKGRMQEVDIESRTRNQENPLTKALNERRQICLKQGLEGAGRNLTRG